MSPEQLQTLAELSKKFDEGGAGINQVKQLSALLSEVKQLQNKSKENDEFAVLTTL